MKKKIICAAIAIATMCLALFSWWLSGSEFERSPMFAFYIGISALFSLFVYFAAYIWPFWDDYDENDYT